MDIRYLFIIYLLTGLNVALAARIWALSDHTAQQRWAVVATAMAVALSAYVVTFEGDGDLTPLGAIGAGTLVLALGMWLKAWR